MYRVLVPLGMSKHGGNASGRVSPSKDLAQALYTELKTIKRGLSHPTKSLVGETALKNHQDWKATS